MGSSWKLQRCDPMFMVWGELHWILQLFDPRDRVWGWGHHGDSAHVTPGTGPERGVIQETVEM